MMYEIPSFKERLVGGINLSEELYITYSHRHAHTGSMNQLQVQAPPAEKLQTYIDETARVMTATGSLSLYSARVSLEQRRPGGLKKVILRPYEHNDVA